MNTSTIDMNAKGNKLIHRHLAWGSLHNDEPWWPCMIIDPNRVREELTMLGKIPEELLRRRLGAPKIYHLVFWIGTSDNYVL